MTFNYGINAKIVPSAYECLNKITAIISHCWQLQFNSQQQCEMPDATRPIQSLLNNMYPTAMWQRKITNKSNKDS